MHSCRCLPMPCGAVPCDALLPVHARCAPALRSCRCVALLRRALPSVTLLARTCLCHPLLPLRCFALRYTPSRSAPLLCYACPTLHGPPLLPLLCIRAFALTVPFHSCRCPAMPCTCTALPCCAVPCNALRSCRCIAMRRVPLPCIPLPCAALPCAPAVASVHCRAVHCFALLPAGAVHSCRCVAMHCDALRCVAVLCTLFRRLFQRVDRRPLIIREQLAIGECLDFGRRCQLESPK